MDEKLDKRLLPAVLNSVSCGVLTTDANLRITSFNRSAELITGWTESEVLGRECSDILRPADGHSFCPLRNSLTTGESFGPEILQLLSRDERVVPVRVHAQVLHDSRGRVVGGVQSFGDMSTIVALRKKLENRFVFHEIISQNRRMMRIFDILPRIADNASTVLLRGESGTGKELFARAIHELSPRSQASFIAVNCAALPDNLLEAELFGYVKGAFTDARQDRTGRISAAHGGTLFLDEIGDVPLPVQVKLLRFLQDHKYEPLGSNRTQQADVRVIAATHRNLEEMIRREQFRTDFYYRLNVITLDIPPLRERIEDIPLLVDHFRDSWSLVNDKPVGEITPEAMRLLMKHHFPGNVRELENLIEQAAVMAAGAPITPDLFPLRLRKSVQGTAGIIAGGAGSLSPVEEAERDAIQKALHQTEGAKIEAAKLLGISRATLWRKMKKYGLG